MATPIRRESARNDLPTLLYPEFPTELADKLPNGVSPSNIHSRCVCWNCMPDVWDELPEHFGRFNPIIDTDREVTWAHEALKRSCDIRAVLGFMVSQLNNIHLETLTPRQKKAVAQLDDWKHGMDRLFKGQRAWTHIPDCRPMAAALDTLFFKDCVGGTCSYHWITHVAKDDPFTLFGNFQEWSHNGFVDQIWVKPVGHPLLPTEKYMVPQKRLSRMISTVIHEQMHQLLVFYPCNGNCKNATESQRKLCAYLYARTVDLFFSVAYKGENEDLAFYHGHGPAFQALGRQLQEVSSLILQPEAPLHLAVEECKCKMERSCLSHCCHSYHTMQKVSRLLLEEEKAGVGSSPALGPE